VADTKRPGKREHHIALGLRGAEEGPRSQGSMVRLLPKRIEVTTKSL